MSYDDQSQPSGHDAITVARADIDSLPIGATGPATGNAITGSGTVTGASGSDVIADAPGHIVAIDGAGATTAGSNGSFVVAGQYGVLTINPDGSYSYVRNAAAPDGVQDVFTYTLADDSGATSSSTLTIDLGIEPAGAVETAAVGPAVPGAIVLPAGVELSDIHVVGRDLVVDMPDGTQMVIPGGAVFVPQIVIGDVEVPAQNLAALLVDSEPQPAAGPPQSSGGNFAEDVPPLDPGVPLGDLIPPTELTFQPPEFQEVTQFIDEEPTTVIVTPDNPAGAVDATDSVDEAGLPAGSDPAADSETTTGTIEFEAADGLQGVTINGVVVTAVGQQIDGQFGVLTITGIADGAITYSYTLTMETTDVANQPEVDSFAVTVTDSDGDTASSNLDISIVDDVPTANDDSATQGADNAPVTVDVSANDIQGADGVTPDHVALVDGSLSGSGQLVYNGDGTFTYTPTAGESGDVTFNYQITDGDGDTSTATVTIHLQPDSEPTISTSGDNSVDEAGLSSGSDPSSSSETAVGTIDIDSHGDVSKLVIDGVDVTSGGTVDGDSGTLTVTHNADGTYSYSYTLTTPTTDVANQPEVDSFSVTVTDSDGDTASTNLGITIADDVPTATDDSATQAAENAAVTVDVLANDTAGADGVATSAVALVDGTLSGGGVLAYNGDGSFTYTPAAGESGDVTFDYQITDGDGDSSTATVTIHLSDDSTPTISTSGDNGVDEAALASGSNPDSDAETAGGTIDITTGNDSVSKLVIDGVDVTAGGIVTGDSGTLTVTHNADGTYSYSYTLTAATTDVANQPEVDSFSVTVTDSDGDTASTNLGITIADDVPTATDDSATQAAENAAVTVDVLANDTAGADGVATSAVALVDGTLSGGGVLAYNGDGSFTYTPAAGETGDVTFDYQITDGDGDSSTATVTIHLGEDSTPTISTSGDNSVDEAALSFGSDPDSDAETAAGSIDITTGNDSVSKLVIDGVDVTTGGTVTGDSGTLTVTQNADGTYSYSYTLTAATTDVANQAEVDSFSVTVTDSDGDTASTNLGITIVDDVPTATPDTASVTEGASVDGDVLGNDSLGADGAASGGAVTGVTTGSDTSSAVSGGVGTSIDGAYGTLTLQADGTYTYAADPNSVTADAIDHFVYTISDADGDTSTVTLDISVNDVTVVADNQEQTVDEAALDTAKDGSDLAAGTVTGSDAGSTGETVMGQLSATGATTYETQTVTTDHGVFELKPDGSYTYTLTTPVDGTTADNGTNTVDGVDQFTYTAHDANGNSITGTVTINVTDDVPTAQDDTDAVATGSDAPETGNVISGEGTTSGAAGADEHGADGASVSGLSGSGGSDTDSTGGFVVAGEYGTLTMQADGSYSYVRNAGSPGGVTDSFTYTITDGDGDTSTATLDIDIDDATPSAGSVTVRLDDDALSGGNPGGEGDHTPDTENTSGTLPGSGGDGSLTFAFGDQTPHAGVTYDTSTPGTLLVQQDGTTVITVTLNSDGTYSVTQNAPFMHDAGGNEGNETFSLNYTVTDADGDTAPGTLVINVDDDTPVAQADTASVTEGASVDGDVLGNDSLGADGAASGGAVTGVTTGSDTSSAVSGGVGTNIDGAYGTLTLQADGTYTYAADPNSVTADAIDHFVYTITDADGDTSTVTLDISVNDVSLGTDNQEQTVDEAALDTAKDGSDLAAGTVTGSDAGSTGETVTGQLSATGATTYETQTVTTDHGVFELKPDGSYTYTLTTPVDGTMADNGTNTVDGVDQFTYTAHDANGNSITGTVTINVTDDVPTANDDSATQPAENAAVTVDVLTNDTPGADGVATSAVALVDGTLSGTGTLLNNGNGSFTYTPGSGETGDVTFDYQIMDGDGDTSTATVTIHLGEDSTPTISTSGDNSVDEAALSFGSDPDSTAETAAGSIDITTGNDSVSKLVIDGVDVTTGGTVTGDSGTLTVTHNADGTYSYSYTLTTATTDVANQPEVDSFSVTVTDSDNSTATTTLGITIADDTPIANDDSDSVAAGTFGPEGGNVISGEGTDGGSGGTGADVAGADGNGHITALTGAGGTDSDSTGGFVIAGQYGTLTMQTDGSYSYVRNAGTPGGVSDSFTYSFADGDGDSTPATLTIDIANATPKTGANATVVVDDDDVSLAGNPGGTGDVDPANTTGTLAGSGGDGPLTYGLSETGAPTGFSYQLQTGGDLWVMQGTTHVLTVTVNSTSGAYSVTQVAPIDHDAGGAENDQDFTINYTVTDQDSDSAPGTLKISVNDDTPTLGTIQVIDSDNATAGPDGTGTLHLSSGADGFGSVTISPDLTGITSGGHALIGEQVANTYNAYADVDGSGTISPGDTPVFSITVDPAAGSSGEYTFDLQQPLDGATMDVPIDSSSAFGAGPTAQQILSGDAGAQPLAVISGWHTGAGFDESTWLETGTAADLSVASVNGSTNGWGVDNNNFTAGEFLRFDFGAMNDFDGDSGPYEPPSTSLPNVSTATFNLVQYGANDTLDFVVHYVGGGTDDFTYTGDAGSVTISAPPGQFIDYIELYTPDAGAGKIDLASVGTQSTTVDVTIPVDMIFTDGDGDMVTGSTTIHVADGATATTPEATVQSATLMTMSASTLITTSDTTDTKQSTSGTNTILMGALAAAGLESAPLAAEGHDSGTVSTDSDSLNVVHSEALQPESLDSSSGSHSGPELTQLARTDSGTDQPQLQQHSSLQQDGDAGQLTTDAGSQGHAPAELPQGTDAPAHGADSAATAITAAAVSMPAAQQLAALNAGSNGEANHVQGQAVQSVADGAGDGHQLGQVLADALAGGGGHGGAVEAVLGNLASHGGGVGALQSLASGADSGVPAWDSAGVHAFAAAHPVFTMETMMLHHDAAPATHS